MKLRTVLAGVFFSAGVLDLLCAQEKPASLGPLERVSLSEESYPGLLAVNGNPRLGLAAPLQADVRRVGRDDRWCLAMGEFIQMVSFNRQSGQIESVEVILAGEPWCLSPDGSKLFATRTNSKGQSFRELFDLASGSPLGSLVPDLGVADLCFDAGGTQLILLQVERPTEEQIQRLGFNNLAAVVSWYDPATGALLRRVPVPLGASHNSGHTPTDSLAVSGSTVYVALTGDREQGDRCEGYVIREGATEAVAIGIGAAPGNDLLQVRTGGLRQEWVVFYNRTTAILFREENGKLVRFREVDVSNPPGYSADRGVWFSPDGKSLMVSGPRRTRIVALNGAGSEPTIDHDTGWWRGDYTGDGRFFIGFGEGGGAILDPLTMKRPDQARLDDHPIHCCPITDAGYSSNGNLMLSNDKRRLLLWSKEGALLAELGSPNEEARGSVEMQSAIFVDSRHRIYAADGWDFLMWDLNDVAKRVKRKPVNTPRVVGTVVFNDREKPNPYLEVMNIGVDSTGMRLVTATRTKFLFRPIDTPDKVTRLIVSGTEIASKPRSVEVVDKDPGIVVTSGSSSYSLDPAGANEAKVIQAARSVFHPGSNLFFRIRSNMLESLPPGMPEGQTESMQLPREWFHDSVADPVVSPDGKWVAVTRRKRAGIGALVMVDWLGKRIVREIPLKWSPTSVRFSRDGSRLTVGSSNRAVYVFDVAKVSAVGDQPAESGIHE